MTIVFATLCFVLVGLFAYRERETVRERLRAQDERAASLEKFVEALDLAERERKELYQRIQAPEIAVHDAQLEARRQRPYVRREPVGADNDAAFAARRAERQAERNGDGE